MLRAYDIIDRAHGRVSSNDEKGKYITLATRMAADQKKIVHKMFIIINYLIHEQQKRKSIRYTKDFCFSHWQNVHLTVGYYS